MGRGRPRKRPDHLVADKGYSYPRCRRLLRRRGIAHTIPERSDQHARRASRPGRPLAFDRARYRGAMWWSAASTGSSSSARWRPAIEKRAVNYRAMVVIASLMIWLQG
jgi:hypothetical protein